MIFAKEKKPVDWGTHSFKDFSNSLQGQTKLLKHKFKHLKNVDQTQKLEKEQVPNLKYHSETWDSKHMDKFLKDPNWTNSQKLQESRNLHSSQTKKSMKSSSRFSSHSKRPPGTADSVDSKQSYFFITVGRFQENEDNFLKKDYNRNYSEHNFQVYNRKTNAEQAKKYFDQKFNQNNKEYQQDQLEFSQQPIRLASPLEKRSELQRVKTQQGKFRTWKQKHMDQTKSIRVHKCEYNSGIIELDNPYNFESDLYREEAEKIRKKENHSREINARHKKQLAEKVQTNANIEFFNKEFGKNFKKIDPKCDKITPLWNNKKRISNRHGQLPNKSYERLFGGPIEGKYSISRAQNLKQNDLKGKDYNFLGYNKSHLEGFEQYFNNSSQNNNNKKLINRSSANLQNNNFMVIENQQQ